MPTDTLPASLTFKRSRVRRYDAAGTLLATHRRARFVIQNGEARVFHDSQEPTLTASIADGQKVSTRQVTLTTLDGERWVADAQGCGCGQ